MERAPSCAPPRAAYGREPALETGVEEQDDRARAPAGAAPVGALRRLLPLLRPFRARLIVALTVSFFAVVAQVGQPLVVEGFIDQAMRQGRRELIVPFALVSLGLGLVQALAWVVRRLALGSTALGVEYTLRNRLYEHLQRLPIAVHDQWQSGQLVSRAVNDIAAIRRFLGFGLAWMMILTVTFVLVIAMLFRLDVFLALITVAFCTPVALLSHRFGRTYREISERSQDQLGDLTTIVEETANGIRVLKAYGREPERSAIFATHAAGLRATLFRGVGQRARFWSLDSLFLASNGALIILVGGTRVANGPLTLGGLVAFISFQVLLVWPARDIGWIVAMAEEAFAASDRVQELLDIEPIITDAPGAVDIEDAEGRIVFEDVTYTYPGTTSPVLEHFDLEVAPGETVALVGLTGCGKSTAALMVPRFHDPDSGRVTFDGLDLRMLTLRSLRSHIGVAFEDPILFSASVRENLLMGHAEASDEQLWDALEAVQADEFVHALPWQLDTRIGEQGYSLSGGQRQRLALARAIVGQPRVLILDDPLSSVDVHTEAAIEAAMRPILKGRSALLIAHRPSTVLLADRVALLNEGRVVATGTHHDLLETSSLYREVMGKDTSQREEVPV